MELQTVAVRFVGELVGRHKSVEGTVYTLYRTPEGRYFVHISKGMEAWLETGQGRQGIKEERVRSVFPELPFA